MKRILPPRRYPVLDELTCAAPTSNTVIVADTDKFCIDPKGVLLPDPVRNDIYKRTEVGVITAVGSEVEEVSPGDVILYKTFGAYRIPNGLFPAFMFKIDFWDVIVVLGRDEDYLEEVLAEKSKDNLIIITAPDGKRKGLYEGESKIIITG